MTEPRRIPQPLAPLVRDGSTAAIAASYGATQQADRVTRCGVWLGRDFFNASGHLVLQSMTAVGNPRN